MYEDFRFDCGVAFDDVPFHVKSMVRAKKISFAPDYYYHYRYANPNSVNNTSSNGIDIMKIVDLVEDFLRSENYFEDLKDEFYYFKLTQIFMYMMSTNTEDYFQLAKENILELTEEDVKNVPKYLVDKCEDVVKSNSFEEYKLRLQIKSKKSEINKLSKKNKYLMEEKKKADKVKKEILTSRSWEVTKPLRGFKRLFK